MKREFAEFLFKRIGSKLEQVSNNNEFYELVENNIDDIEVYLDMLKTITLEVLKP